MGRQASINDESMTLYNNASMETFVKHDITQRAAKRDNSAVCMHRRKAFEGWSQQALSVYGSNCSSPAKSHKRLLVCSSWKSLYYLYLIVRAKILHDTPAVLRFSGCL